jgi:hypothetical protein
MSLIVNCNFCGERISLRKMPHGKHVPFNANTDDQHKCRKSDKKKVVKKTTKNKKTDSDKPIKISETVENYVPEANDSIGITNKSNDAFENDTLESLKNEIEVEVKEKKDNKTLFLAAIAAIVIIIIFLS